METAMHVEHFEKGVTLTDRERMMIAKKLGRISRYCVAVTDESSKIRFEAERRDTKKDRDTIKVMITVDLPHKVLRAESRRSAVIDAVERCIEKLEAQVKKYKEMHMQARRIRRKTRGLRGQAE